MNDLIIVALVGVWIFFMFRRGGCCGGGRSHEDQHNRSSENKGCCHQDHGNQSEKIKI
ncbi:hypothetical protein SAMN05660297_01237 [Natronincola peptidivorans]|uniref:Uncharacterized protein n=1 Tax=Natronincola peptidivorans TaxID=426128 RepID=A0A1I0BFT1_9FIRM|nr:hypothetical protein [Natronincola peptidivorans]SET05425.1 hypothetical protein SAMN05660297_01237 [Natronincola peptidivorans]